MVWSTIHSAALQWNPHTPIVFASFVICTVLAIIAWRYRDQPAAVPFAALMGSCAFYAGTKVLEYSVTTLEWSLFWWRIQYFGWVLIPPAALLFALEYTGRDRWITRSLIVALAIMPTITLILAFTSWFPGLIIQDPTMVAVGDDVYLDHGVRPWYHIDAVYTYLVLWIALLLLFEAFVATTSGQRNQVGLLVVGIAPLVVLPPLYYYVGPSLFDLSAAYELEPYLFVFTGSVFAWSLFKYQVLDTIPVPFESLLETTPNGVLVVDDKHRVVEANRNARAFLDVTGPIVGQSLATLSEPAERIDAILAEERDPEIRVGGGVYRVSCSRLTDARGVEYGHHVVIQDVTKRIQYDQLLEQHNEQLETLNQMLRHDIRNDTMVALGWTEVLTDTLEGTPFDDETAPYLERIDQSVRHIVDLTLIATELSQPVETPGDSGRSISIETVLEEEVEKAAKSFPEAAFELHETPNVDVVADSALASAVSNVLRNAVVHNDKETPRIDVSVETVDDRIAVHIADNGPGIPESMRDRIFDRGVKGERSDGSGLGLHLVRTFVEWYDGSIEIDDNEPEGSIFTITLPIVDRSNRSANETEIAS
ncbi:histidine kinase N-terminal 7TM domain-containing protein [Halosolutus gelatinilyticus]|uniref:histidine kinase N-terminal 7TM domain-containing protein n=1 Tax=Halosolutus gelatinilyticus TaxID=2931975 RepID=UPI001FF421A4|nr:histidine kinase N-terminal 7TM domain-containing protein [Halosolutus gelatinilyticus]